MPFSQFSALYLCASSPVAVAGSLAPHSHAAPRTCGRATRGASLVQHLSSLYLCASSPVAVAASLAPRSSAAPHTCGRVARGAALGAARAPHTARGGPAPRARRAPAC